MTTRQNTVIYRDAVGRFVFDVAFPIENDPTATKTLAEYEPVAVLTSPSLFVRDTFGHYQLLEGNSAYSALGVANGRCSAPVISLVEDME